jgi:hypothetical protein
MGSISSVLARGLDDIEPTLARQGYSARALADVLQIRPTEIRAFLRGCLPAGRAQELQSELRGDDVLAAPGRGGIGTVEELMN